MIEVIFIGLYLRTHLIFWYIRFWSSRDHQWDKSMNQIIVLGPFLSIFIGDCKSTLHVVFLQSKASLVFLQVDGFKSLPIHCKVSFLICPGDALSSDVLVLTSLYRLILFLFNVHLFGDSLSKSLEIMLLVSE